jgi:hypothetical protein
MKSQGLGDTIEKFTKATGIKKIVDTISEAIDIDCGCEGRKVAANNPTSFINRTFYKQNLIINKTLYKIN